MSPNKVKQSEPTLETLVEVPTSIHPLNCSSEEQELDLDEIYSLLVEGKKLLLEFPTELALTTVRTKLHELRTKKERNMLGLGIMEEEERTRIYCAITNPRRPEDTYKALFSIGQRPAKIKYKVLVIESSSPD